MPALALPFSTELEELAIAVIESCRSAQIPRIIARDRIAFPALEELLHIIPGHSLDFGTLYPEGPAPEVQTPPATQRSIEGELLDEIDVAGVSRLVVEIAVRQKILGRPDPMDRLTDHEEGHVERPAIERDEGIVFLHHFPEAREHLFFSHHLMLELILLETLFLALGRRLEIDRSFGAFHVINADGDDFSGQRRESETVFQIGQSSRISLSAVAFPFDPARQNLLGHLIQALEILSDGFYIEYQGCHTFFAITLFY